MSWFAFESQATHERAFLSPSFYLSTLPKRSWPKQGDVHCAAVRTGQVKDNEQALLGKEEQESAERQGDFMEEAAFGLDPKGE